LGRLLGGGLRACDAIYRFLASLKLAVISLGTLSAVLAYATYFESTYGTAAAQEWIYKSKGFAILLLFLGANILCAALIRFPWKLRQTGFVITHTGLLILLAGSWMSVRTADEGQLGMLEGETQSQLVRMDYPVVRVRKLDPHTQAPVHPEYVYDVRPGNFAWGPGRPRPRGVLGTLAGAATLGLLNGRDGQADVLANTPDDPFKLVVKSYLPASMTAFVGVPDPQGGPMAKIRPRFKGPGMPQMRDILGEDERWFIPDPDRRLYRAARTERPAQFAFLYVDRPELVQHFLNPPRDPGKEGVARIHYKDSAGKDRDFEWRLEGQSGKPLNLPDSDLTITFEDVVSFPLAGTRLEGGLGESSIPLAQFRVRRGDGPEVPHYGWASLPMFPNVIPNQGDKEGKPQRALVGIDYYLPPEVDPGTNGLFGVVEVLGTPEGKLYYRVFGRGEEGQPRGTIRAIGPVDKGQEVVAFGGNANAGPPMTLTFQVEDYLPAGREKEICEAIVLPKGEMSNGIPAALAEMTVDGQTQEFWIRRSSTLEPVFQRVSFPDGTYEVSFDVDRKDVGFNLKLDDFEVGFDPGTEQASKFVSQVRLTDEAQGINDQPHTISMNEPLTHRGYTFYQSSYNRHRDPKTGQLDGQFQSVFQVATDPAWPVKYLGCFVILAGAFVQFYMRAGIFTDGGRRERQRAADKARKRAASGGNGQPPGSTVTDVNENESDEAL
jgi:hypothetical protein